MSVEQLVEMSNRYGSDEFYVLAGGGNTSMKENGILYVKGSGTALGTITAPGFVKMEMPKLTAMLGACYPEQDDEREAKALADMMAARCPGEEHKRPSVESILHAIFPFKYVLHVHPPLVNGLSCGKNGEEICRELFGGDVVWIALTKPGYVLARVCVDAFAEYKARAGRDANIVILQNHGIFIAADSVAEIDAAMSGVMEKLQSRVQTQPDFSAEDFDKEAACELAPALRMLYAKEQGEAITVFCANRQVSEMVSDDASMLPLLKPFTPDHIVYCKAVPLYLHKGDDAAEAFDKFIKQNSYAPKIVAVQGLGFFAVGSTKKEAEIAKTVFLDAVKIAVYSRAFGGALTLPDDFTDFIVNWEFESYRIKQAVQNTAKPRMKGKVCIVTGSAQGFGKGIAEALAAQGAYLIIADLNLDGAKAVADGLCETYGEGAAISAAADVSSDESVSAMVQAAVLAYGGLDVLVSNAGILIAGGLEEMTKEKFELVTAVNYTGYFLCAKHASIPMKIQHKYFPERWTDIIEINSKSGLEGSNKNFAYAGSKFGGLGLTQSFAMELVAHGIKVNAVCPGNLLDGPLWSDPEKGLFKQYLDAGKVAGAKTVEDVRRFYEAKVPMGRGCTTADVARAILYIVEQEYETGQAVPVTGGQVMLK